MKKNHAPGTGAARALAVAVLLSATLTGCADGDGNGSSANSPTPTAASPTGRLAGTAAVGTRTGDLGTYLVDGGGLTLYLFEADTSGDSTCYGGCAEVWPPLTTTGEPQATGDADGGLLGTTTREDDTTQVTYNGHPLYYYQGDSQAGDTKGQGLDQFGAAWYVLDSAGDRIQREEDDGPY
ncbi:hypothetical protein I3F58_23455 [Streptomyces sp. MUM 203J]|uniref:COG4315 family predicted lipoprotein n=1 Tax=Streptomyces sp. MUM 203J TaxID=2791990 RepID=UPI001F03D302|nr:hypothetical protein [Streptomyces sp. MUM 203J]MCH0542455.1 hypothetical protein [Streptomyces sp. MUM 203J]